MNPFSTAGAGVSPTSLLLVRLLAVALLFAGDWSLPVVGLSLALLFAPFPWIIGLAAGVYLTIAGPLLPYRGAGALLLIASVPGLLMLPRRILTGVALLTIACWSLTPPAAPVWVSMLEASVMAFLLAAVFLPHCRPAALWVAGLWHAGLFAAGIAEPLLFLVLTAPLILFADWPDRVTVIWDGNCGFCARSKGFIERFDFDRLFDWHPFQSGIGGHFGLSEHQVKSRLYAATPGWVLGGYQGIRRMTIVLPVFWIMALTAFALAPAGGARQTLLAALLLFLSPLSNRPGSWLYDWVARHRHELLPGTVCAIPAHPPGRPAKEPEEK